MRTPTITLRLRWTRLGDYSGEREALEKASEVGCADWLRLTISLGFLDLQADQAAEAEKQFKTAIALDPQYAEAQNNLGRSLWPRRQELPRRSICFSRPRKTILNTARPLRIWA